MAERNGLPPPPSWEELAVGGHTCPRCSAGPGTRCVTPHGIDTKTHKGRMGMAKAALVGPRP